MTADTITAIKKALEGVTPGPWHAGHLGGGGECQCQSIVSEGISGAICTIHVDNGKLIGEGGNDAPPLSEAIANMHYIAAVDPVAISALLSTLESLQRENEELRKGTDHISAEKAGIAKNAHSNVDYWKSQYEAEEAEVKRYREALHIISAGHACPIALANNALRPAALSSTGDTHGN